MSDDDQGDKPGEEKLPSQIPLLVDVVESSKPARPRKRPKRENYSLDLNPEPPQTRDLFEGLGAPGAPAGPATSVKIKAVEIPVLKTPEANPIQPDPPAEAPYTPDPAIEARMEAKFRREANELVDNLVKQYSEEILHRLREELTTLLDDLNADEDGDQKTDKKDP